MWFSASARRKGTASLSSIVKLTSQHNDPRNLEKFVVRPLHAGVPEDTVARMKKRGDPVSAAREKANLIEDEALKAAAEIRQTAWSEGYAEGCKAAESQYQELLDKAQREIEEFEHEKDEYWQSIEPELVSLAVEIAEKIIRSEVSARPEAVLDVARSAIRQLRQRESIRLHVNPGDLEVVRSNKTELLETTDGVQHLEIVDDRRVDRGGVVIESDDGMLDARIKTQLSEVEKALAEAVNESSGHEE